MTSETKQCTKCGEVKPATNEFYHKMSASVDGLQYNCKVCLKQYEIQNKDRIRERKRKKRLAYYEANKEEIEARKKEKKEATKEKRRQYERTRSQTPERKEYERQYREKNKERIAARQNAYMKEYNKTPKGKWFLIKSDARVRNKNFDLSFEYYKENLWGKPCHYCGINMTVTGLDRKDNDKGYTPDNVVPSCRPCNVEKMTKPYEEFMAEIKKPTGVNNESKVL